MFHIWWSIFVWFHVLYWLARLIHIYYCLLICTWPLAGVFVIMLLILPSSNMIVYALDIIWTPIVFSFFLISYLGWYLWRFFTLALFAFYKYVSNKLLEFSSRLGSFLRIKFYFLLFLIFMLSYFLCWTEWYFTWGR